MRETVFLVLLFLGASWSHFTCSSPSDIIVDGVIYLFDHNATIPYRIGNGNYRDRLHCFWHIETEPPQPSSYTFTFTKLDLEYRYDYVYIWTRLDNTQNVVFGNYTGYLPPPPFEVPTINGIVLMEIETDSLINFLGFQLNYVANYCPGSCGNGYCNGTYCVCRSGWTGEACDVPVCPNNCSGNGYCENSRCVCDSEHFDGDCSKLKATYCSGVSTLAGLNGSITDHFPNDDWNAVAYLPNTNCTWIVDLVNSGPTTFYFDRHQTDYTDPVRIWGIGAGDTLLTTFNNDGFAQAPIIAVHPQVRVEFTSDSTVQWSGFTLKWMSNSFCPNGCSEKGYCIETKCACFAGYTGADCSSTVTPISASLGVQVQDRVGEFEWKYFSFQLTGRNDFLTLSYDLDFLNYLPKERWGGGHPVFFMRWQQLPSYAGSDVYTDYSYPGPLLVRNPPAGTWIVGVFGLEETAFKFVANAGKYSTSASPNPTDPLEESSGNPRSFGWIIGLTVGLLSVLALVLLGVGFAVHRRRKTASKFNQMKDEDKH